MLHPSPLSLSVIWMRTTMTARRKMGQRQSEYEWPSSRFVRFPESIYLSSLCLVARRASMNHVDLRRSAATSLTSGQLLQPISLLSLSTILCHVVHGLPTPLLTGGVHVGLSRVRIRWHSENVTNLFPPPFLDLIPRLLYNNLIAYSQYMNGCRTIFLLGLVWICSLVLQKYKMAAAQLVTWCPKKYSMYDIRGVGRWYWEIISKSLSSCKMLMGHPSEQTSNRAWNRCHSLRSTQWLKITGSFMQQQQ